VGTHLECSDILLQLTAGRVIRNSSWGWEQTGSLNWPKLWSIIRNQVEGGCKQGTEGVKWREKEVCP